MLADTAVGDDWFGGYTCTPFERAELPAPGAKAGLELGNADLAWPDADLGGIRTPVFQINHGFGGGDVAGDDERRGDFLAQVGDHGFDTVGVAMGNVDGDVFGGQTQGHQLVYRVVIGLFDTQGDRGVQAARFHVLGKQHVVQIKAVHDVEVAVLRQPDAQRLIDHGLHVGGNDRDAKSPRPQLDTGIAFRAAVHAALAGQQQNVVVVKDFHGPSSCCVIFQGTRRPDARGECCL
ncbi:hypothetical protein GALL_472580 [mine drainage metagenome]|uniref:Uncharacterized protein n=1 Tax=mine drainage metagenome TaxID=410659 RepID=A0A1J5PI28_9ZZZZ